MSSNYSHWSGGGGGGGGGGLPSDSSRVPYTGNGRPNLRTPEFDNTAYVLISLVVIIPIIFTIILCIIAYCIYRRNKNQRDRAPTNYPLAINRCGSPIPTVIYNTQHSPFVFEELPPSYDSLGDIKKNPYGTNQQVPLTILPSTILANSNEEVTSAAAIILPTAPIAPPSPYINRNETNQ